MKRVAAELGWPTLGTALGLCVAGFYPIDNPDTFGHLAAGRQIAELGRVPKLDSFSYFWPQPAPWVNYEWLSDRLFYAAYQAGGYPGLTALKLLLLATLAGLLIAIGHSRAGKLGAALTALVVIADLPGLRFRLSVRPHLFGLVFAALYVLGLSRMLQPSSRRQAWLWVAGLALTHVAWVNLHGSHLFGLGLCGLAGVCGLPRPATRAPLAALFVLLLAASCVSPYGPAIVSGALVHALDPAYRALIDEWQAWKPSQSIGYPLIVAWHALWLVAALRGLPRDGLRIFSWSSAALLLWMAVRSLRFIPDFLLLTAPSIAAGLAPRMAAWAPGRRRVALSAGAAGATCLAVLGCLQLPPGRAFGWGESTGDRPAASSRWLARHLPQARIFATIADAWDLMFTLPHAQFLVDGRTPFYGPAPLQRVQRAWSSPPALRTLLDETRTDVVIVQPLVTEQQLALHALLGFADFQLVMIEDKHCVFARVTQARAQLLSRASLRVLQPGYDVGWILAASVDTTTGIREELAKLEPHPNVQAYRSWVLGLTTAKPLVRAAGRAGFAAPHTAHEQALIDDALRMVRSADQALGIVPSVIAYHALLAISACRLDEAREALTRARAEGRSRELLFATQELALRSGAIDSVRTFVTEVGAVPAAASDPWLAALRDELAAPPPCAAAR